MKVFICYGFRAINLLLFNVCLMAIETPEYRLLEKNGMLELRQYKSIVIAVTKVQQPYKSAQSEGFRRIASYIFGGNENETEIAMTAPVISTKVNTIIEEHEVFFIIPRNLNIEDLPKPNLKNVKIEKRNLSKVAAIKFGGWATEERVLYFQDILKNKILELGYSITGDFMVAQYNSPWALPPFRKNEILVQIKS